MIHVVNDFALYGYNLVTKLYSGNGNGIGYLLLLTKRSVMTKAHEMSNTTIATKSTAFIY